MLYCPRDDDVECALVLGRWRAASSLRWRRGPYMDMGRLGWLQPCHDIHSALSAMTPLPDGRELIIARCRSSGDDGRRSSPSVGSGHSWPLW